MVAAAMIASTLSVVLLWAAGPASALVEDFNPANWNMQGAQNAQDNKWQSGVRALINAGHDVIALQEAGQVPASAGHLDAQGNWAAGPLHTFGGGTGPNDQPWLRNLNNNQGYTVQEYQWRPSGSRGPLFYIYFMQTDFGANRVNLAIATSHRADAVNVARPGWVGTNGTSTRPALGIRINNTYFWSVHASARRGYDASQLLENIDDASGNRPWAALGDYNREPQNLAVGQNMHIYRTGQATHYGGNGNNHELDYMVTNEVIPTYTPGTSDLGSDHRAVYYYTMRANADIQIRVPHDGNQLIGKVSGAVPVGGGANVGVWPATEERLDTLWHLIEVPDLPGYYNVVNNELSSTGKKQCWNASQPTLTVTDCNSTSSQIFQLAHWTDNGQIAFRPYGKTTCVGDDANRGVATPLLTTASCSKGEARLNGLFKQDPGEGATPIRRSFLLSLPTSTFPQPASTFTVAADGSAQYRTVQDAINAVPADGAPHTIVINKGTYNEVVTVPKTLPNLIIRGATGKAADVVIKYDRCHGYLKPDGTKYGTEGSAVASFKAPDLRVEALTIQNTFDPNAHPEISPFETQAVALAATGDRQVYTNLRLISTQDTVLAKSPVATDQTRQYFRSDYIAGNTDFLFGNATAVFDRSTLHVWPKVGGTIVAPNTDQAKKYGLLITNSKVMSSAAANTFYLGRPWHNTTTAQPQAVIRDTELPAGITTAQPWTNMTTDYTWQQARFKEYHNYGTGAGVNSNRPQLTDAQAGDYTAQKYLAGTDGWNPVW
ncbi:pectinesterase family protein [Streptomyces sp. NPDC004539]|uniref:pectinesterase family protein n=1 Tax=Streptomyces sp. NPDC004539 TaxID=3154280 RepID=UPI0033AD677A